MVLVDTSVWIDHFHGVEKGLAPLLETGQVHGHPLIIGELACGQIKNRDEILSLLAVLPSVTLAEHEEIMQLIDLHQLYGKGLGFIDVNLLASCMLSKVPLWTKDKKLRNLARDFDVCFG